MSFCLITMASPSTGKVCPKGLVMGVPDITMELERPWYPTGIYFLKTHKLQ